MDGWVLFFQERAEVDPASLGRFSLCKIKDGASVVATIKRGYQDGTYNLFGPLTRENVTLEYSAPIIFTRN